MLDEYNNFEIREKIKNGIDKAYDYVKPTLGAVGMSAFIDMGDDLDPIETDDGITVLENLLKNGTFKKNRYEQIGLKILKKAVDKVNNEGGDGTSTTTVKTKALCDSVFKEIGHNSEKIIEVCERLDKGLEKITKELKKQSKKITEEDIERVATISSLDSKIGKIIAEAYKKIGKDGIITVENSNTIGYSSEVVNGVRFNKGFQSLHFVKEKNQSTLENPYILIVDGVISNNNQIVKILNDLIANKSIDVVIIADNVEGEAFSTLVLNHKRGVINACCIQPPNNSELKKVWMSDIAILTGATVVSKETGILMENIDLSYLGKAERVTVTLNNTTIINGKGNEKTIKERIESLQSELATSKNEIDKTILKERLANIAGGIGVIRVGAFTDTEYKAKKYKIEDAINSTKSAMEEGVIIGGGSCLAKLELDDSLFDEVLIAPLKQMAINAGMKWWEVLSIVKDSDKETGFNFKTRKVENLLESGVIDSVKVIRLALECAVSVAKSLARCGVAIIREEDNEQKNAI